MPIGGVAAIPGRSLAAGVAVGYHPPIPRERSHTLEPALLTSSDERPPRLASRLSSRLVLAVLSLVIAMEAARASDIAPLERRVESARKKVEAPFAFLEDPRQSERLIRLFEEHRALVVEAREWLDDRENYPVPAKAYTGWVPGSDVQPGHDEMEVRVSRAVSKHNELMAALARSLKMRVDVAGERRPSTRPLKSPAPKVHQYGLATIESGVARLLEVFPERYADLVEARAALAEARAAADEAIGSSDETTDAETEKRGGITVQSDFPRKRKRRGPVDWFEGIDALARGDYDRAREVGSDLEGLKGEVFWHLRAHHVLGWNDRNPGGHDGRESGAVRVANAYRISLRYPPLAHHPKTQEMADDFALQMKEFGFMGHVHPSDPTRATLSDRARRIGYESSYGENCSSVAGGESNMWRWRADAGHHRTIIAPMATEVGFAVVTRAVLNTGDGYELPITRLFRFDRY